MKRVSYRDAITWLKPGLVLCNNVPEIDPGIWENIPENLYDPETDEDFPEIFQFFITSFSESDIEWMNEKFPKIYFAYSEKLDCYILLVDHFGTSWDYVPTDCTDDELRIKGYDKH